MLALPVCRATRSTHLIESKNYFSSYFKSNPLICTYLFNTLILARVYRSSPSEVFLRKGVLKICSRFTREHPCRSVISMKLQSDFIEIALRHGCFPVNFLHIFRTLFYKNTSDGLHLS